MFTFKHLTANSTQLIKFEFRRELAMEAYIIENERVLALDNKNFNEVYIVDSELHVEGGRSTRDGRIDLLALYGNDYLGLIELKMGELNDNHVQQLSEYLSVRDTILKNSPNAWDESNSSQPKWLGVLVGSTIKAELAVKINNGLTTDDGIPIVALTLQRFRAEDGQILVITDVFANLKNSSKDFTRYIFNGTEYGKGRLIHALVSTYVQQHKNIGYAELKQAFPDSLIKAKGGVFVLASEAIDFNAQTGRKRHYINPDEVILLADGQKIATSTQWEIGLMDDVIKHVAKLGLKVTICKS